MIFLVIFVFFMFVLLCSPDLLHFPGACDIMSEYSKRHRIKVFPFLNLFHLNTIKGQDDFQQKRTHSRRGGDVFPWILIMKNLKRTMKLADNSLSLEEKGIQSDVLFY